MSKRLINATLATTLTLAFSVSAQAAGLWIFGDSLSDSGNNTAVFTSQTPPGNPRPQSFSVAEATLIGLPLNTAITPPGGNPIPLVMTSNTSIPSFTFASGTYSDGAVWSTRYASSQGLILTPSLLGGTNYAYGGAVTSGAGAFPPSMVTQVAQAAALTGPLPSNDLYVLAGGGNNIRAMADLIQNGANIPTTIQTGVQQFVRDIIGMLTTLESNGASASKIVVWGAPNLAATPAAQAGGVQSTSLADAIGQQMNIELRAALQSTGQAALGVRYFDVYGLATQVPSGINTTDACAAQALCNPSQYLFYDGIHPTSYGHQVIAERFAAFVPVPSALALLGLGLAGLLATRRKQK
jgi:outer membrane lipase/esterase